MNLQIKIPTDVKFILNTLNKNNYKAYIVGGSVRDSILNRPVHDWDITTSATPEQVMEVFKNEQIIPTGLQHGTVTIMLNRIGYEVTTFRIDGNYSDGRRPDSVKFTDDIVKDLSRRDFTINAIAYNDEVGLVDPFNGMEDLKNHIMRCVGNPKERFSEDILRTLRLWRFCIQLGFYPNNSTSNAAKEILEMGLLKTVSYERIQTEFIKAIQGDKGVFITQPDYFLESIIPEWKDMNFPQNNPYHIYNVRNHSLCAYDCLDDSADTITRIATLLHDIGKPHCYQDGEDGIRHFKGHGKVSADMTNDIMKRLRFDNDTREKVVELVYYHDATFEVGTKYIKRWLNKIGEEQFRKLLKVRRADIKAHNPIYEKERLDKIDKIEELLDKVLLEKACFSLKDLAINGNDIKETMQIKEGKDIGYWLNEILNQVINGELNNNKDELVNWMIKMKNSNK